MDSDQNLATIKALLVALFTSSFVHVFSAPQRAKTVGAPWFVVSLRKHSRF